MNLNDLTLGQIKELQCLFGKPAENACCDPLVGQYVILRCYSAGVHAGVLVSQDGEVATLKDSRRLWGWKAKGGIALSGVAQLGLSAGESKVDVVNPVIRLTGVIETIPCSATARESIQNA